MIIIITNTIFIIIVTKTTTNINTEYTYLIIYPYVTSTLNKMDFINPIISKINMYGDTLKKRKIVTEYQVNELIHKLNTIATSELAIDCTFYLRIDIDTFITRIERKKRDRLEMNSIEFFRNVIIGYDDLARNNPRIITIDATEPMNKIHEHIVESIYTLEKLKETQILTI